MARKRGRKVTGRLIKRGRVFYLRWRVEGQEFSQRLTDAAGEPVTNGRKAQLAAEVILRPYQAREVADLRRAAADALQDAVQAADAAIQAARPRLALADAWTTYVGSLNRPQSGEATMHMYRLQWAAFVRWMAEHRPAAPALADVTPEDAENYMVDLAGRLAAGTVNKHRALLDLVFRVIGEREPLPAGSPFAKITPRRAVQAHREELRPETLWRVFEAADGELRRLLFVGLYSGQRLADCALLRWEQVDLRAGFITFRPQKTRRLDAVVSVPLVTHLRNELETTPEADRQEYVMPATAQQYKDSRANLTRRIQRLFIQCGVETHAPGTGPGTGKRAVLRYGFHSLRHSTATMLQEAGAPAAVAEAILGHRSTAMRQRYTHIGRAALVQAMKALPAPTAPGKDTPKSLPAASEPERERLAALVSTASIEAVRAALAAIDGKDGAR